MTRRRRHPWHLRSASLPDASRWSMLPVTDDPKTASSMPPEQALSQGFTSPEQARVSCRTSRMTRRRSYPCHQSKQARSAGSPRAAEGSRRFYLSLNSTVTNTSGLRTQARQPLPFGCMTTPLLSCAKLQTTILKFVYFFTSRCIQDETRSK